MPDRAKLEDFLPRRFFHREVKKAEKGRGKHGKLIAFTLAPPG
jgi:hypothetical protein